MSLHRDGLIVRRLARNLTILIIRQLYCLLIKRCLIIDTKVLDETVVEEFFEMKDKINEVILSDNYSLLVSKNKIVPITDINKLQVPQMKG